MPEITPATLADVPQLAGLLTILFTHEVELAPDATKQERALRLILAQPETGRIYCARGGDRVLGMVSLLFTISTAEGGFVILLEDVIVHQNNRAQGIGGKLLKHAVDYAKQKNFLRITLLTDRANEEAQKFFKSHGFLDSKMIPLRMFLQPRIDPDGPS